MCCFLTLIFWGSGLDFGRSWANLGPNLGPNLVPDPQLKFKKSIFFAILGQLGPKSRPKTPRETQNEVQERPKTAKMRPKGIPRQPK